MMSILLEFVRSQMLSRNPRMQNTVECCIRGTSLLKDEIEGKKTSMLAQMYDRKRILVMLQIMWPNISYYLYVITKISAIISRFLTRKFEQ